MAELLINEKAIIEAVKNHALGIKYEVIEIPENVEVKVEEKKIYIKGPKGELEKDFSHIPTVWIIHHDNQIIVACRARNRKDIEPLRTVASKIRNMIRGVQEYYVAKHKVAYAHFPMRVKVDYERKLILVENWYGRIDPIKIPIFGKDTKVKVINQPGSDIADEVIIYGPDKDAVMLTSGRLHDACKLRGRFRKDTRIFMDGIWRFEKGWASDLGFSEE